MIRLLLFAVGLGVLPAGLRSQAPLDTTDFVVGKLREGLDSAAVRRAFGAPDSVLLAPSPFDVGGKVVSWRYDGLMVHFQSANHVRGITVTARRFDTRRGLSVGDSVLVVEQLYGAPSNIYGNRWIYQEPGRRRHVMRLTVEAGRVTAVYLGWLVD